MRFIVCSSDHPLPVRFEPDGPTVRLGPGEGALTVEWTADGGEVRHEPGQLVIVSPEPDRPVRYWRWDSPDDERVFRDSPDGGITPVTFTVVTGGPECTVEFEPSGMPVDTVAGDRLTVTWQGDRGELMHDPEWLIVGTPSSGPVRRTTALGQDGEEIDIAF
ncbi:hypothetical protein ACIRBX_15765 [Kitasatospora sp. NPDC096147]|uniref:hypothetical protein n=1 Tax=Kitasatospora sp. NPDC096147 TaxID=3364093 RepID=UPI003814EB06